MAAWISVGALDGCGGVHPGRPVDVLLISVDTARADRFSYAGGSSVPTPSIDALASEGTVFLQAVSPAPITLPAHTSLLTGQLPVTHGVHNNGTYQLRDEAVTLAEVLRDNGFRTSAFVAAAVLDSRYGLAQGFGEYDDDVYANKFHPERRGEEVVSAALRWLDLQDDQPTFVWVHLFDPHAPYEPPEPERLRYAGRPYDGEIAYVDRVVGLLLEGYRERKRYERALIVFTSDHGESLGEHGEETHGTFIYDASVRVPLVIRAPGLGNGRTVGAQVQLVDVFPTVTSLLGAVTPETVQGRDLTPLMLGEIRPSPPAYIETRLPRENYGWSDLRGIRTASWKLVSGVETELYALEEDPGETRDVSGEFPERVSDLVSVLESEYSDSKSSTANPMELDEATRERLTALGYITLVAGSGSMGEDEARLPDPRDRIHLIRARSVAAEAFDRGHHLVALRKCESILDEDPGNAWVARQYLKMLIALGALERAEAFASSVIEADPGDGRSRALRGLVLERLLRPEEALADYAAAFSCARPDPTARARRWELLDETARSEVVESEACGAAREDDGDGSALAWCLRARWRKDPARLVDELREAVRSRPDDPELSAQLGDALLRARNASAALSFHRKAQSLDTTQERYAIQLGRTLRTLGRDHETWHLFRNMRARGALLSEGWYRLGEACLDLGDVPCAARSLRRVSSLEPGALAPLFEGWHVGLPPEGAQRKGRQGDRLYLAGRFDESAEAFAEASRLSPGEPRWSFGLGLALEAAGAFEEALAAYAVAIEGDAGLHRARDRRWRLLLRLDRAAEVVAEAKVGVSEDPSDGRARAAWAIASADAGDASARARALDLQLQELPDDPFLLTARADTMVPGERTAAFYHQALGSEPGYVGARVGLARSLLAIGRVEEALEDLADLYRWQMPTLEIGSLYGEALARSGDFDTLREVLALMIDLVDAAELDSREPDSREARLRAAETISKIGGSSWEAGRHWTATQAYALGTRLVPRDPGFHFNLGLAWERVGDLGEALVAFDRTLQLDPDFPRAREHREFAGLEALGR